MELNAQVFEVDVFPFGHFSGFVAVPFAAVDFGLLLFPFFLGLGDGFVHLLLADDLEVGDELDDRNRGPGDELDFLYLT